jgi:hypothetical protein
MGKRPVSITIISALFFVTGLVGLAYHAKEMRAADPFRSDVIAVLAVRLLAVIGAVYLFQGKNWARWLLVGWLAFHVVLSAFHSASEALMHAVLLAVIAFFLFRPRVSEFLAARASSGFKRTSG